MAGGDRKLELDRVDAIVVDKIRRPIYRGKWEESLVTFDNVDAGVRDRFLEGLKTFTDRYDNVKILYVRVSERIDGRRADVRMRTGITGTKKGGSAEQELRLVEPFEAVAKFEKRGEEWVLIDWPTAQFFPQIR